MIDVRNEICNFCAQFYTAPMTLIALLEADYKVPWEDRWAVCSTPLAANKGSPG